MRDGETHLPSELLLGTALVFAPLAFGATESWSRAVVFILIAALLTLRLSTLGFRATLPDRIPPLFWAAVVLMVLAAIQSLNPVRPLNLSEARIPFTVSRYETLEWIFDWSLYAAILLFVPGIFRSAQTAERLAWLLLTCGAVIAIIGVAQQQAGNTMYYGIRKVSEFRVPFGPYPNKNHAASFLAMCALVGAGLAANLMERWNALRGAGKGDEFFGRLTLILALEFLVLLGLFKANSRGAVVAMLGAGGLSGALYVLHTRRLGMAVTTGFFLAAIIIFLGVGRYSGTSLASYMPNVGENSLTFRYAMISDGLKIISQYPVFGLGLGALEVAYPLWMNSVMKGFYTDHLHCDPIELAAEAGLPLAGAFYAAYISTLALCARRPQSPRTLCFLAAATAILVHQVLDFPSHIMSLQLTGLVCLAASWGQGVLAPLPAQMPETPSPRKTRLAAAIALLLSLALCVPRLVAAYLDLLASRYPQPSKTYYETSAVAWEGSFERHLRLARSNCQLSVDNPVARSILLRTALAHTLTALKLEPLHPAARSAHASVLEALGHNSDAAVSRSPR